MNSPTDAEDRQALFVLALRVPTCFDVFTSDVLFVKCLRSVRTCYSSMSVRRSTVVNSVITLKRWMVDVEYVSRTVCIQTETVGRHASIEVSSRY